MATVRVALPIFIATCEEEDCNADTMFEVLLMLLEYNWDEQANRYFDGLREASEKAKEYKACIA